MSVPLTSDKVHIRANHDTIVVYLDRVARSAKLFFYIDIMWVGEGLGTRDKGVQLNNLLVMAQGLVVISFNVTPSLFCCKSWNSQKRVVDNVQWTQQVFCK